MTAPQNEHVLSKDLGYKYPGGLNLRPDSELSKKLVERIRTHCNESLSKIQPRFPKWRELKRVLQSYVTPEAQAVAKADSDYDSIPEKIVIPLSYMALETLSAQYTDRFLQTPYFRYSPVGPEDVTGAILMTKVIEAQNLHYQNALDFYTCFKDQLSYGIGPAHVRWDQEMGRERVMVEQFSTDRFGDKVSKGFMKRETRHGIVFEGNRLESIAPELWRGDVHVPPERCQDGQNNGWWTRTNLPNLLSQDKAGNLFNVRYLKELGSIDLTCKDYTLVDDVQSDSTAASYGKDGSKPVDVFWVYSKIIPKDYDLGDSEYPEKWQFVVASNRVILSAEKMDLDHGDFPISVAVSEVGERTPHPVSKLERTLGLQNAADLFYNTKKSAILQAIHQIWVVNPKLMNLRSLRRTPYGSIMFMSRRAESFGLSIKDAIMQLPTTDASQDNLRAMSLSMELMQKSVGASDATAGFHEARSQSMTATELQAIEGNADIRAGSKIHMVDVGFFRPIGMQMASNTRQFQTKTTSVDLTGEFAEALYEDYGIDPGLTNGRLFVSPEDLNINTDLQLKDQDPGMTDPNALLQYQQNLLQDEESMQEMDMPRLNRYIAKQIGLTGIDSFRRRANIQQDENVLDQVQRGNLVPNV